MNGGTYLIPSLRRRVSRRALIRTGLGAGLGLTAVYVLACGGDGGPRPATTAPAGGLAGEPPRGITPLLVTQELVAGRNRLILALLDDKGELVEGADVHLRFFELEGDKGTLRSEAEAQFRQLVVEGAHVHPEGVTHVHEYRQHDQTEPGAIREEENISFYVAETDFERGGSWGVEVTASLAGESAPPEQVQFAVLEQSMSPAVGEPAVPSRNAVAAAGTDLAELCSRDPPCPLHSLVMADSISAGRPLLVNFSTPAFCTSRVCGPVLEVVLEEEPDYRDRVDFVHIEVWEDFSNQTYAPPVREWNLPTEPYTFLIDGQGRVVEKLEAIFTDEELRAALDRLVAA